ncbi:putative U3 small nucleolar ribonucleoprotein imp4 [Monocercomonoides exilis]|uniref:putative U3 small nucleolar ribonucleoprotein imp4 n=1 Tax=Monocercomonoides exilis TaxID=2049356 RepID=UPI00355A7934|nr:putative U3 small nucleolar ribonucleoprotein imp4 [Monocercomonoides exilis]|eukprot:MONOS_485.1-p1 / transcript=MONOS_485.1 / gene=MONOS_485 / organism=Monocercomonoides_exilis_PA203 / gene_product=U3 small nucleolar ribonucleoprotein protein imp4, putative / transcript_product=U3 small nucleolar ribonucleoprotein protein imp4, putative / location=Mono_scaffold00007:277664-278817(+) / protein_length=277 / sequence_SO=supercontig / SO=protein_coding / is_pseudo=false
MLKRTARLRREYIYKKSLRTKEALINQRKRLIKQAELEGKPIPTELRYHEKELSREIELDDEETAEAGLGIDDEYADIGVKDPKIVITTSRDPSSRLLQFVKRINRGSHVIPELIDACRTADVTDLIIIHEHRGEPDGMIVSHLPYGPTSYFGIVNTVLRHDIETHSTMPEEYPHLIFHNLKTPLGIRVRNVLQALFPVPKPDSKRIVTFFNQDDYISFRHHKHSRDEKGEVVLEEIGPRFEMRLFKITLGTADIKEADVEFELKPYMNTAKKAKLL